MPTLLSSKKTTITLPDSGLLVTVRKPTLQEAMILSDLDGVSVGERINRLATLAASIGTWDATDEAGNAVPLTAEAIQQLSADDGMHLLNEAVLWTNPKKDEGKVEPPKSVAS